VKAKEKCPGVGAGKPRGNCWRVPSKQVPTQGNDFRSGLGYDGRPMVRRRNTGGGGKEKNVFGVDGEQRAKRAYWKKPHYSWVGKANVRKGGGGNEKKNSRLHIFRVEGGGEVGYWRKKWELRHAYSGPRAGMETSHREKRKEGGKGRKKILWVDKLT